MGVLGFEIESLDHGLVVGELPLQNLDGHITTGVNVLGAINRPEATLTEALLDAVFAVYRDLEIRVGLFALEDRSVNGASPIFRTHFRFELSIAFRTDTHH